MSIAAPAVPDTATPSDSTSAMAPLRDLLDSLRRRTRRWIWIESLALACLAGAAVFWLSLAIDWLLEPPSWWRMAVVAASAVGLFWMVATKLAGRLATPLSDAALATLVERGHPAFRDSLSTAVELADQPRADVDPALLARTVAEAAALVDQVDRPKLFRRRRLMGLFLAGLGATASIAGLALARPAIADLWVRRHIAFRDDPWPRQVALTAEGFCKPAHVCATLLNLRQLLREPSGYFEMLVVTLGAWWGRKPLLKRFGRDGLMNPLAAYQNAHPSAPRITYYYGARAFTDAWHARMMGAYDRVRLVPLPTGRHNTPAFLKERGQLAMALQAGMTLAR